MRFAIAAAAASLALMLSTSDAAACGGAFFSTAGVATPDVAVTDHRFVFKLGTNETVLWDQIRYTGAPSEFAWVLPIHAGATLELSHDEFMATLDSATKATVFVSVATCDTGGGCGGDAVTSAQSGGPGGAAGNVTIVSQQTIGPYDVLTLHSNGGQTIGDFLTQNGFAIPAASKAIIDAYTSEGFDFIAMRLRPGQGVQAMQPVRVITQGADPSLPLRMIGAGAGASVGITMWVIAEGRYQAANFPNALVPDAQLKQLPDSGTNFGDVETSVMAQDGGRTWLTEYAGQNFSTFGIEALTSTYQATCQSQGNVQTACDAGAVDAGEDAGIEDAGGLPLDAGACTQTVRECATFDDFDVALRGLDADNVWLTRMRANLPVTTLTVDLQLGASPTQTSIFPNHVITTMPTCDDSGCESAPVSRGALGSWALAGITAAMLGSLVRRRRSPK